VTKRPERGTSERGEEPLQLRPVDDFLAVQEKEQHQSRSLDKTQRDIFQVVA